MIIWTLLSLAFWGCNDVSKIPGVGGYQRGTGEMYEKHIDH